jgi:hypothetical protein
MQDLHGKVLGAWGQVCQKGLSQQALNTQTFQDGKEESQKGDDGQAGKIG